jgi:hypothetical protein
MIFAITWKFAVGSGHQLSMAKKVPTQEMELARRAA